MSDPENNEIISDDEDLVIDEAKIKRQIRWKIFGWCVIGLMTILILTNLIINVEPVINQAAIAVLFVAYVTYIILRRR
jgi:hypothetical protein